ncbi:MAG: DUF58 domain-containing protein [Ardenticatenaceae bacterium]|nr:DUF58 domain-containing protein [Ardenticatenaceae bacterium]MCB9446464.1 DUF58 domain-containing protein [Ardenticatenaceae bacterium]
MMDTNTAVSKPHIQLHLGGSRLTLLWFLPLLLAAILLPNRIWNMLLISFGGLFIIAYIWVRLLAKGLSAQRRLQFRWVSVGDQLHEQFTLMNDSLLPALWVEILDFSNVPGYRPDVVRSVSSNNKDQWKETAVCQQRGQFHLGPWAIRSGDPFGIFTVTRNYPANEEIIIHPPIHGNLSIPLPAGQSSGRVRARQKSWQATVNASTVRDYHPNDPMRWIHWPTSAHRDELFVREFDLDAAGDIWILLDMATAVQLGSGPSSTEEHAVLLAASLAAQALNQNRAVGLATYGQTPQIVPAGQGQGQQWKILRALALVNADGQNRLAQTLADLGHIARRGAAAIIITPTDQADWIPELITLKQRGIQSHITLLDRPSFGGTGSSEGLRQAVRQLGFQAQIICQGDVGQPIQEQERRGYWEFKITPTGRAIAVNTPYE